MRHTMRHTIGVILCLAVLGTGFAVPAAATFAGTNGRLVFSRQGRVFTMDPDGTNRVLLTSTGNDYSPVWSPDGQRIAFIRGADAGAIWVMKADGTGAIRVSAYGRGWVQPPIWSPDGRSITYWDAVDTATGMVGAIFRVTPDGSSRTRLTTYGNVNAVRGWSPDGSRLIFESDRDGDPDIWVMNADGTGLTRLTASEASDESPAWSPR